MDLKRLIPKEKLKQLWAATVSAGLAGRLPRRGVLLGWAALAGLLVWSYWAPLASLAGRWWRESDYLHCFLIIPFAAYLLWFRADMIRGRALKGSWWGLAFLGVCALMRWGSAYFYYALMDPMSLVPCLAGLTLFLGGWRALWWAWPSVVILAFMVPLPGFASGILSHPLQRVGTIASTYLIQTIGIPAVARGNVIGLSEADIGVVEACSGLRMMMLFVTVCFAAALVMDRSRIEKMIIVLSAAPIAVLANVARITTTAMLHEWASHDVADVVFHDLAGWFMMPLAVMLLWGEMWLFSHALVDPPPPGPVAPERAGASGRRGPEVRRTPRRENGRRAPKRKAKPSKAGRR